MSRLATIAIALLVGFVLLAPSAAEACTPSPSPNLTGTLQQGGQVDSHVVTLNPCETVLYSFEGHGPSGGNIVLLSVHNGAGTVLYETNLACYASSPCRITLPYAAGWEGRPVYGTKGPEGLPRELRIKLPYNWGAVSYVVTQTKTQRVNYNLGGLSIAEALHVPSSPATVYASFDWREQAGQYFRVTLPPAGTLQVHGFAEALAANGSQLLVAVHAADGSELSLIVYEAIYGREAFTSSVFTNPNSVDTTFYLRVRGRIYPMFDVVMTVDATPTSCQTSSAAQGSGYAATASAGCEETQPPTLTVLPATVQRGELATFTTQAAQGATASGWTFGSSGPHAPVNRESSQGSLSWTGQIVQGGTASVTVVQDGVTYQLSRDISVTPRPWGWTRKPATPVPNGTLTQLPSPPIPNGFLGYMQIRAEFDYTYATVNDGGPNHDFRYLTAVNDLSDYRYQISPDLSQTNSTFFSAQCGDYNAQTQLGFIGGSMLLSNIEEHEFGVTLGHYAQYESALQSPSTNPGIAGETLVAGPGTSEVTFADSIRNALASSSTGLEIATISEAACNSDGRFDPACVFRGNINFGPPYASCF